jgi:hypothetical protein
MRVFPKQAWVAAAHAETVDIQREVEAKLWLRWALERIQAAATGALPVVSILTLIHVPPSRRKQLIIVPPHLVRLDTGADLNLLPHRSRAVSQDQWQELFLKAEMKSPQ